MNKGSQGNDSVFSGKVAALWRVTEMALDALLRQHDAIVPDRDNAKGQRP